MEIEAKLNKRKLNNALQSIKVMLANKRRTLSMEEWLIFVARTKAAIISHPTEYLGYDFSDKGDMTSVINDIFETFIQDQKMR